MYISKEQVDFLYINLHLAVNLLSLSLNDGLSSGPFPVVGIIVCQAMMMSRPQWLH